MKSARLISILALVALTVLPIHAQTQKRPKGTLMEYVVIGNDTVYVKKLFLTVSSLCCFVWAFSRCSEWGLLFVVVYRLLVAVAFLAAEHEL